MTTTVDERRRVLLPKSARPGEVYSVQKTGAGHFVLERVNQPVRMARMVRKNGLQLLDNGHRVTQQDVEQVMAELP